MRFHNPSGPSTIVNRINPCNCGCGGTDSQHAQRFRRVVKEIEFFNEPRMVGTKALGMQSAVAKGIVRLNNREDTVFFTIITITDDSYALGWYRGAM